MKKIKVCVVDDNRELVGLLDEYISSQDDMEVVGVAHNGQDCLDILEHEELDVLVLDIIMPHLDGLAVLERLRDMKKAQLPNVIMLTAFGQEDVTKKAVDLGASYFILKPFDMKGFYHSIQVRIYPAWLALPRSLLLNHLPFLVPRIASRSYKQNLS